MKFKILISLLSVVLVLNLTACSRIKGYFPDKEKDYQLTTEIPPLSIPEDLSSHAIETKSVLEVPVVAPLKNSSYVEDNASSSEQEELIYVDLVEFSGGATRIRVEDSIDRVWRTVGKAISRHSIEITNRNESERIYYVQYDPDFKEVEDGSLWDEALFIFGADPAKEQEFKIRLAENGSLTEIIVLDRQDTPLSTGPGYKLLNLLYKTIKKDLSAEQ